MADTRTDALQGIRHSVDDDAPDRQLQAEDDELEDRDLTAEDLDATGYDPADVEHMHLADDDVLVLDEPPDPIDEVAESADALVEAFNARDLDAVMDVLGDDVEAPGLGNDRDNLPDALDELWERCPSCLLTRGDLDGRCVAVLWELGSDGWRRAAILHVDDVEEDGRLGVVELSEDPVALEEVVTDGPDGDLEEGSRWIEWDEGAES